MPVHVHFDHLLLDGFSAAEQAELLATLQSAVEARVAAGSVPQPGRLDGASLTVAADLPISSIVDQAMSAVFSTNSAGGPERAR